MMTQISLNGIKMHITRKRMRSLRIRICSPTGEVKISAPLRLSLKQIKHFITNKIDWIKRQQIKIFSQKRELPKKFIDGEEHYFLGEKHLLKVFEKNTAATALIRKNIIELHIKKNFTCEQKRKILENFYRIELKKIIPEFISVLEKKMNVTVKEFGIKKMKTRWGTCNPKAKRIWINLELAKKPLICLQYLITHEMVHLLERKHNKKFFAHMDHFMPSWRECKNELRNSTLH